MRLVVRISITIVALMAALPTVAHDLRGVLTQELNNSSSPQIQVMSVRATGATRSVLANLRLWPVPRKLSVCFIGGSAALRKRVADAARSAWPLVELTEGRLQFAGSFDSLPDCPANPTRNENIRIGFTPGDGHWSYVGVESLRHAQSMNFDGFTESYPADDEFARVVGHEFGHALGLEHEHQSPKAPDCGWDFNYIRSAYVWKDDEDMHRNFDKLTNFLKNGRQAYPSSTYDKTSLMHYVFEKRAFLGDSECYKTDQNNVPSDQDKLAIAMAYGPDAADKQKAQKGAIPQMLSDEAYKELRSILLTKQELLNN